MVSRLAAQVVELSLSSPLAELCSSSALLPRGQAANVETCWNFMQCEVGTDVQCRLVSGLP